MKLRIYSNWFDDPDGLFWMFDTGPGTPTRGVSGVSFNGVSGKLVVNQGVMLQESRDLDQPKAWIEVDLSDSGSWSVVDGVLDVNG